VILRIKMEKYSLIGVGINIPKEIEGRVLFIKLQGGLNSSQP